MLPLKLSHRKRLTRIGTSLLLMALALFFVITTFEKNIHLYLTPSEIVNHKDKPSLKKTFRIGGLIKPSSVVREGHLVTFVLTDHEDSEVTITYQGPLPSLFREGQGAVVEATMDKSLITASKVLVKHDERYSPPKVVT